MFFSQVIAIVASILQQYQSRKRLEQRQLRFLLTQISRAKKAPYYGQILPETTLKSIDEIAMIPILEKESLRNLRTQDFVPVGTDLSNAEHFVTSGSTGKRVEGFHDRRTHDYHTGALVRRFMATGLYKPWDRLTHIKPYPTPKKMYENFGLFRRHVVLSYLPMIEIIEQTLANQPHILLGIPTFIREFIRESTPAQIDDLKRNLKAVFTESELLVEPHRRFIEKELGVPVFDEYSAFEALNIYFECSHGGRHVAEDRLLVEILDETNQPVANGQEGHIVVSPFMEQAMPLLRYRIGDWGKINAAPCPCGRTFKTMEITKGRTADCIMISPKKTLFWADLVLVMMAAENALDCYVYQDRHGHVNFYFVPRSFSPYQIEQTKTKIREQIFFKVGETFPLTIEAVERIPKTPGGKGKLVHSEIPA